MLKLNHNKVLNSKRDHNVFKKLFDANYRSLVLFAINYVDNTAAAEDIVQEVFIDLWKNYEKLADTSNLRAYLYVCVRNTSLNYIKHQKVKEKYISEIVLLKESSFFYKEAILEEETHRLLMEAIKGLPETVQKICLMSLNGAKNAEIATSLNISGSTVKYHKKRAHQLLYKELKNYLVAISLISLLDTSFNYFLLF